MIQAYLATYKVYVFADSPTDANEQLKKLRLLSQAMGFDPGAGNVATVRDDQLDRLIGENLKRARLLDGAVDHELERAIRGIASHFDGDEDFARELVDSIQAAGGRLSKAAARAFSDAYKRPQETA